ncbi:tRNA uracil 4-sulfurtransferase ThiI [Candidatus Soleaferrea massiliensis]|uniref:tRNA uracil 4-sulfurtransferase ThiI n=1 Tax=Candidatus Soleaferrea massiliensis TaxID=1470354 RepID=UPI00059059E1|nr:tRNA uracil 4-sulfurtransferase ThiI [Candidatus Soleaferrea massiliensis]
MKEIILLKSGEIALKGLNKSTFEQVLIKNCRRRLQSLGAFKFSYAQSTICVTPMEDGVDMDEALDRLQKVFGIASLSRACVVQKDYADIRRQAVAYLRDTLMDVRTFKVEAKRSDKSFPMNSPELCRELGGDLLQAFPHLKVDVHNPDVIVTAEIRDFAAYVHAKRLPGAGGMPVSTSGRASLLISGGIDSPVAGYMMAKRGLEVVGIHFESPPYTSMRAKLKVMKLLQKVSLYAGRTILFVVPFTEMQEAIKDHCPEELFTVIMRRFMMRIAQRISYKQNCGALITGESLAQVASQTMPAIQCTDAVCDLPVFRPLIGMDKGEIVAVSRKIDTFETSIEPYEDCCTVFTPKHPRTRPKLEIIEEAERKFDFEPLIEKALENLEMITIDPEKPIY